LRDRIDKELKERQETLNKDFEGRQAFYEKQMEVRDELIADLRAQLLELREKEHGAQLEMYRSIAAKEESLKEFMRLDNAFGRLRQDYETLRKSLADREDELNHMVEDKAGLEKQLDKLQVN